MRVECVGEGTPVVAAVGAIHGDEPCGATAIDRFLSSDARERVERPAKLIVVNERALHAGKRFVDADLNRVFPGDPTADAHERRLAHRLVAEIDGCLTLGFHSTVSDDRPFGTLASLTPEKATIMRALPVDHVATFTDVAEGRSVTLPRFVNVEAGRQGSDRAAENAARCLDAFFTTTGVLPGEPSPTDTALYRVFDVIEKDPTADYTVHAENFSRVPAGTIYAETADGRDLQADRDFWPVLISATGHRTVLGYRSTYVGEIGAVAATQEP